MFDELMDRLTSRSREIARLQGAFLADLVAVASATPVAEFAAFEIASALTWTRQSATVHLALAQDIVHRLPAVHGALSNGDIDLPKARVIVDAVTGLPLGAAREVAAQILPVAPGMTTGQLRAALAKLVIAVDPSAAAKRVQAKVGERRVSLHADSDGCATLVASNLPAAEALAASNRLTAIARALKQAGDPRTFDQLRSDTMLNLLLGKQSSAGGSVEIVASLETLTKLSDDPGHLNGYGPVIADIARQVAEQQRRSPWSYTVHDTATGRVYTGSTRRRPDAATTRHIRQRDRTCRAPGCRVPARRADIDHTVAWEQGGPTTHDNLGVLCRHHHRAKHEGGWQLRQTLPGAFVWQSPLRRIYHISPEPP